INPSAKDRLPKRGQKILVRPEPPAPPPKPIAKVDPKVAAKEAAGKRGMDKGKDAGHPEKGAAKKGGPKKIPMGKVPLADSHKKLTKKAGTKAGRGHEASGSRSAGRSG